MILFPATAKCTGRGCIWHVASAGKLTICELFINVPAQRAVGRAGMRLAGWLSPIEFSFMKKIFAVAALTAAITTGRAGDITGIQLSLTPDIALYPRTMEVHGLSLNIWGENPQFGLTLGLVNGSRGESAGFSWGIVNYAETYHGVEWGVVNVCTKEFIGWQRGIVNVSEGTFEGYESGIVNVSQDTTGFQLGVVNYARHLDGLQIGLANIAVNNPWFTEFPDKLATGFPIVNWSF